MADKRILIVEDDEDTFFAISQVLRSEKYTPLGASSNQFADLVLNRQNVDALILDLNLFDQSGTELLQRLRQNPQFSALPIIVHTGRDLNEADKAQLLIHANEVIVKSSTSIDAIIESLEKLVD